MIGMAKAPGAKKPGMDGGGMTGGTMLTRLHNGAAGCAVSESNDRAEMGAAGEEADDEAEADETGETTGGGGGSGKLATTCKIKSWQGKAIKNKQVYKV